jgi:hypothetical protein
MHYFFGKKIQRRCWTHFLIFSGLFFFFLAAETHRQDKHALFIFSFFIHHAKAATIATNILKAAIATVPAAPVCARNTSPNDTTLPSVTTSPLVTTSPSGVYTLNLQFKRADSSSSSSSSPPDVGVASVNVSSTMLPLANANSTGVVATTSAPAAFVVAGAVVVGAPVDSGVVGNWLAPADVAGVVVVEAATVVVVVGAAVVVVVAAAVAAGVVVAAALLAGVVVVVAAAEEAGVVAAGVPVTG